MGTLRLTNTQWSTVQAHAERPRITRIFNRLSLGQPAPYNAQGPCDPTVATHWLFDDHRFGGFWRVRVVAGEVKFQEWDELVGGVKRSELSLAEMGDIFG